MTVFRLAFVDDHPTLLRGLAAVFAEDPRYQVVATGGSAAELTAIVNGKAPDVVIVDLSMPGDVFQAVAEALQIKPDLKVIVFTAYANVEFALRAFDTGVNGYVVKGSNPDELFSAIEHAVAGNLYVSSEFAPQLGSGLRNRQRTERSDGKRTLSPREKQLARALLQGKSNREIAAQLQLTEKTVKHYMTNLMTKLGVKNRLEAAMAAQRLFGSTPLVDETSSFTSEQ